MKAIRNIAAQAPVPRTHTQRFPRSVLLVETWHALTLATDLARAGLTVYILGEGGYKGNWMPRGVHVLPLASTAPEHVVQSIDAAVREVSPDIILPVFEETLFRIWDESPEWLPLVHPVIQPEFQALFRDKHRMGDFLRSEEVPVPRTLQLTTGSLTEITRVVEQLGLPIVVKGGSGAGGSRVRIAASAEEAYRSVTEIHQRTGEMPALQEFVDGPTYVVGGVFDEGRPIHVICGEVLEMHPLRTGPAVLMVSRHEEELIKITTSVFRSLGISGLACADFMRGTNGRFMFLELSARPWGSYRFANALGFELVATWCRLLRGEHVPAAIHYPAGRKWAKMPDYLFVPPGSRLNLLRRALNPTAIRSLNWGNAKLLLYETRNAFRVFRKLGR